MTNIKILYHMMPWEIDYALLTFKQLKKSKYYLPKNINITIDTTLNLSSFLIDWEKTKLPQEYFIEKYKTLSLLLIDYNHNKKIYYGNQLYGHLDFQRESISNETDYYIHICPDMYFSKYLLRDLIQQALSIQNEYFMITPQICRMWDDSWEILTHPQFAVGPHYGWEKTTDIFDVDYYLNTSNQKVTARPINQFRWAGWFDIYNKAFYENLVPVPNNWYGYGGWDTYAAIVANYATQLNIDFQQYRLDGQIVFEYGIGPLNTDTVWGFSNYYKQFFVKKDVSEQRDEFNKNLPGFIQERIKQLYAEHISSSGNKK